MRSEWTPEKLIAFEMKVKEEFEAGRVNGPIHLSGGNESQLIEIFRDVDSEDYVFSTWRNHYHALLHGIPEKWVYDQIIEGKSLSLNNAAYRFYTSAIVGGILPIAVGVAAGIKRYGGKEKVWCFVGDMCATGGAFHVATSFAGYRNLPIQFVIEDNGMSTNTPTHEAWGSGSLNPLRWVHTTDHAMGYQYTRTLPHIGVGKKHL